MIEVCEAKWASADATEQPQARRLFHGRGHSYPGYEHVVVNEFPPYLQISLYAQTEPYAIEQLVDGLLAARPQIEGIVLQHRDGRRTAARIVHGDVPEEHVVYEDGCGYFIAPQKNQNIGLFMDMAHVRRALVPRFAGARVLNLFAYTCAFSVAAIEAGAELVVNNDMSGNALKIGERNHALNGHDQRRVRMLPHNLFKSWWKIRQLGPFDLVIIDPPTNQRGSFNAEKSYGQILKRVPEFTAPQGRVIACLNSPFLGPDFLTQLMARWCPACEFVQRLPQHPDFPDQFPERALKVLEFVYRG
ncbi:MAG: class I SAM-dependent methyltransferase [Pseudomonadota bacterium]